MEFIVKTDLENTIPSKIEFNFEDMKTELSERLEYYRNLTVTEDQIPAAKTERASLNKLKEAIEGKRKEIKKKYLTPYKEFEEKVKELVSLIDEPIASIDAQIKGFDDAKKNEKAERIKAYYDEYSGDMAVLVPLDKIWNPKWLNATYKYSDITSEIHNTLDKARNDIKVLKAMKLPYEENVIDVYLRTLDMSAALREKQRMEEQEKIIKSVSEAPIEEKEAPKKIQEAPEEPKTIKVVFYDTTEAFRKEMKALTIKHNIKYGGVK